MIYDDDFPADGHWPGARNFFSLAELSGVAPARPGARNFISLAELSSVTPERSDTRAARRRPIPVRLSWAPEVLSLAELSGVAPERSDTRAARRRPIPDRPSRAPAAAINMAAVRDLVDEKRRAMSPAEWAKATDDGAMIARGMRALKTLPDPQAAMPAFRRKLAVMGVAECAIANIPLTWDPRLADVLIAAHGEMRKLLGPPSREPQTRGTQYGAGHFGAPGQTQDSAPEVLSPAEMNARIRAGGRETPVGGGGLDGYSEPRFDIWDFRGVPYDESGGVELTENQKELNEIHKMTTNEGDKPPIVNMEKARQFAIQEGYRAKFEIERTTSEHDGGRPLYRLEFLGKAAVQKYNPIIEREARRQGVDPDLVRAIMFIEHADGHRGGTDRGVQALGWASSLLPMNIKPGNWGGVGGVQEDEFENPELNIRAAVALIREIRDRIADPNPNAAQIASIYNFTGRETINSYGARVGRAYQERAWER